MPPVVSGVLCRGVDDHDPVAGFERWYHLLILGVYKLIGAANVSRRFQGSIEII